MRAILYLLPVIACSQELYVRSEFQRPGPDGKLLAIDKMPQRGREILSPPAPRNAFTTVHLTVEAPPGTPLSLHIGLNPENAIKPALYLEQHLPSGEPNSLEEVTSLPFNGKIPESGALNFVLDMWVKADARVERVKVEPQLWVPDRWIIYPMEVRILDTVVPKHAYLPANLPPASVRADVPLYPRLREALCSAPLPSGGKRAAPTVFGLLDRNIAQDMAIAARLIKPRREQVLLQFTGISEPQAWCQATDGKVLDTLPTEWFLRVRDILYRSAVN